MNGSTAQIRRNYILLGIFGIAMGWFEAVLVVYLRLLYHPQGFAFPMILIPPEMIAIEWLRELATIVMLLTVALLAGKNRLQKFAYFIYTFAVWDIVYYVGLKSMLDWPDSLFTWDVLFLIPVTWVGPVIAPVICSMTMIVLSLCIVVLQEKGRLVKLKIHEWMMILLGAVVIFITFIWDYGRLIIEGGFLPQLWTLGYNEAFLNIISEYVPTAYNWALFGLGELLILGALLSMFRWKK